MRFLLLLILLSPLLRAEDVAAPPEGDAPPATAEASAKILAKLKADREAKAAAAAPKEDAKPKEAPTAKPAPVTIDPAIAKLSPTDLETKYCTLCESCFRWAKQYQEQAEKFDGKKVPIASILTEPQHLTKRPINNDLLLQKVAEAKAMHDLLGNKKRSAGMKLTDVDKDDTMKRIHATVGYGKDE
jgi:hypothetical protein